MSDRFEGHTPGPWVTKGWSILDKENLTVICNVLPWDTSGCRQEDIANIKLIAAAPDLLAENRRLREALHRVGLMKYYRRYMYDRT